MAPQAIEVVERALRDGHDYVRRVAISAAQRLKRHFPSLSQGIDEKLREIVSRSTVEPPSILWLALNASGQSLTADMASFFLKSIDALNEWEQIAFVERMTTDYDDALKVDILVRRSISIVS
jgi:hypothetical protein